MSKKKLRINIISPEKNAHRSPTLNNLSRIKLRKNRIGSTVVRTCVTKGKISGTIASSIVRAMASKHVAPAIAMFQLSSP